MSRAQLSVSVNRRPGWEDGRRGRQPEDDDVISRVREAVTDLPTYGYWRVWALLRRQSEESSLPVVNIKRVYRVMCAHNLLLQRKPTLTTLTRAHRGRLAVAESNRRWCSDGFEFRCDNGEKLRVTFAQDCCVREIID